MSKKLSLYGSYGCTGSLIARLASDRGLRPILAGRDRGKLAARAATLGWEYRAFSLGDAAAASAALSDIAVVLNCAGPFSRTIASMVAACLLPQTHYLDITGEIAAFQAAADRDADAKAAGIMLLPGASFDIVPSDCLAARLKARLPVNERIGAARRRSLTRADRLENPGDRFRQGKRQRRDDPLRRCLHGLLQYRYPKYRGLCGISRIDAASNGERSPPEVVAALASRAGLAKAVDSVAAPGPTDEKRARGLRVFWGEVENNSGRKEISRLQCAEGYTLTALTAQAIAPKVLDGLFTVGFQTPSKMYGADFILEIDGVRQHDELPAQPQIN